jgi:hypothetical protein
MVFLNENGRFKYKPDAFGRDQTNGWWNCISACDFDMDGDIDFVAGNHGINSRFRAAPEEPVEMYVNDFDNNGAVEQIICTFNGGKSYPLALKHDLVMQIPGLGSKYKTYESYKDQQIEDIFSREQLDKSIHLVVTLLETSVFMNDGSGTFIRGRLPRAAQISPVFAVEAADFNSDGIPDILLGGNLLNMKPETGGYDASYGTLLLGDKKGGFIHIPAKESGIRLTGEVRDMLIVRTDKEDLLFIARSNDSLKVYTYTGN